MRKILSVLVVLSLLLSAGLVSAEEIDWSARRLDKQVTLSFMIDRDQSLDGWEALFKQIEEVLNIKTVFDLRPGGIEGDNLVKSRLATGDMADLCAYNSGSLFK
nr:carbohydrate ABC transporter substrate-binding protein [Bacillota bacterium]